MYDMNLRGGLQWDGLLCVHVDIYTDKNFSERHLKRFIKQNPHISNCLQVYTSYDYCLNVALKYIEEFEAFRKDLTNSVPGITNMKAGVIGHIVS